MAIGEEDLRFKLTVDPDTAKMQDAIKDIGKDLDNQAAQAKSMWSDLGKAGVAQLESVRANERIVAGFAAPVPLAQIDKRAEAMQSITRDMEKQRDLLERINAELDPQTLKDRVKLERQIADARADYVKAHDAELKAQSPAPESGGIRQFLASIVSGQGINTRQLAGSAIGGAIGGGSGGALGAVAGGAGAEALAGALGPIGVAAGIAAGGLFLMTDAITKITGSVARFVAISSPGAFARWEYTVRDFEGVIGQRLTPVLELMTAGLRSFADMLDAILPSASSVRSVTNDIREFFAQINRGGKDLGKWLNDNFGQVLKALQFEYDPKRGSSFGAAAQPAHFTSLEDFGREIQQSALSAATIDIPQKQLNVLQSIYEVLSGQKPKTDTPNFDDAMSKIMPDRFGTHKALYGW